MDAEARLGKIGSQAADHNSSRHTPFGADEDEEEEVAGMLLLAHSDEAPLQLSGDTNTTDADDADEKELETPYLAQRMDQYAAASALPPGQLRSSSSPEDSTNSDSGSDIPEEQPATYLAPKSSISWQTPEMTARPLQMIPRSSQAVAVAA